mmetsp:Transcript_9524/g.17561  ORF Transcript_9524/g.17561 Transcript_9524/m.17561 type:complete len:491 (+) Transcript_9524:346-1818(+)|eukprot:CAMPEP_0184528550 /NCGR_PEP_ID=MMETSP0198_2-20121128/11853_1 /TAXON_ID=1112570 /ORGANISM="Thraustochytrium sp., Strain LLF1b" /LENGTH=490 /DNA_ID=CAMNT_0026920407 /DNA_START=317 /DNA_END=1789 /DNA_ORIENTATION=-
MFPGRQAVRLPPDHQIIKRREGEERRAELESGIKQIGRFTSIAKWEEHSGAAILRQKVRGRFQQRVQQHAEDLNRRREALAELLENERYQYQQEFLAGFETPEQRVERMAEKARLIKLREETKRRNLAEKCYKQRDRLAQDEMRLQQSQMRAAKIAKERDAQLKQKQASKQKLAEEEEEFAKQWLDSIAVKKQREDQEHELAKKRDEDMKLVLDSQVRDQAARRALEEQELETQREKWREQWRKEERDNKAALIRKEEEQRLARLAVQQENNARAAKRAEEANMETEMDRFLLQQQRAKDKEEEELRKKKQAELLKAQTEFQGHLKAMAIKEAEDESELERLRQEESEKEWRKREVRWAKEAADRDALMSEVNRIRELQIAERKRLNEEQLAQDQEFIANKNQEDSLQEMLAQQEEQETIQRRKLARELLEEQIREKARLAEIDRQRELLIDKRAQRYTEDFTRKIEELRKEAMENDTILDNFPRRSMQL